MSKIVNKKFSSLMLGASLLVSLTACGKVEKLSTEETTTEEITIETTSSEDVELGISNKESIKNELSKMVEKTYTEYRKFYDALSISKEEVAIMVDVRNGYYDGYSKDQIDDALADISRICFPDNLRQLLDNCNIRKYIDYSPFDPDNIEDVVTVLPNPLLSELSLNSEDLEIITIYEQLRAELVNEIISTGTYSDSIVQKINNAVIEQENKGYICESYSGIAAQMSLIELCRFVNPVTSLITDSNGKEYQISSKQYVNEEGYVEAYIENEYYTLMLNNDKIPEELLSKYEKLKEKVIYLKYDEKLMELKESIESNASSNVKETVKVSEAENKKLAQESYEEYRDFYDSRSLSEEDISIMIDVINGDVSNYSKDEINSAHELENEILFSKKMQNAIKDYNDDKEVSFSNADVNIPKLSDMLMINDEFKANLIAYENLRDEIALELSSGSYSEAMVKKINDSIVEQEAKNFSKYVDYLESSVNNEGVEIILMAVNLQKCNMVKLVNPKSSFIKSDIDDYEYQIAPRTDENEDGYVEQEVVDKYNELKAAGEEIPDDILEKFAIIQAELIHSKYEQQYNEWKKLLLIKAGYTDLSIIELYNQKKILLSLKEERLFNERMESDLSRNPVLERYALTFKA